MLRNSSRRNSLVRWPRRSSLAGLFQSDVLHSCKSLAGATGLERAASCVTGRRSNQPNYAPHVTSTSFIYLCHLCPPVLSASLEFLPIPSNTIECRDSAALCNLLDLNAADSPFLILQKTLWPAYWTLIGPRFRPEWESSIFVRKILAGSAVTTRKHHDKATPDDLLCRVSGCDVSLNFDTIPAYGARDPTQLFRIAD